MSDKPEKNKPPKGSSDDSKAKPGPTVTGIPNIKYYDSMYGRSFEGNDRKGVHTFKMYESQERLRRLQNELQLVKGGRVTAQVCDMIIGKKRIARFESYEHWAELMLHWVAEKKM